MTPVWLLLHLVALAVLPPLMLGVINRTRALWTGRRGPQVVQVVFELWRLVRKQPVYSRTTTELFRLGPLVVLACVGVTGLLVPLFGRQAPISFPFDFMVLVALWALGRVFLIFSALDTGSAFEGMGASREATWGGLVELAMVLVLGSLAFAAGHTSLAELLHVEPATPLSWGMRASAAACLLIVLQVEASRVPVDDPATHLELTMIHEVMVLDHSGPELAALQYASGLKLLIGAGLIAALLNPVSSVESAGLAAAVNLGLIVGVAIVIAFVESLTARLKLSRVPNYLALAAAFAVLSLALGAWGKVGLP